MKKAWKIALLQADMQLPDLAGAMGRSQSYISRVINRRTSPTLEDAFKIMRILNIPPENLQEYFGDGSVLDW